MLRFIQILLSGLATLFVSQSLMAADGYTLHIKDHQFIPSELSVPANTKFKLNVFNDDATPEEFESEKLHREKVIKGKSQAIILIGPLKPGVYSFVGEFHEESARGQLIAK